ncbi:hypothetical protein KX816_14260 [Sphingosinicellaceae bacterium]|nr:hypothetical protein KX816_14260 [Sphingosinicellaceae bacterium]
MAAALIIDATLIRSRGALRHAPRIALDASRIALSELILAYLIAVSNDANNQRRLRSTSDSGRIVNNVSNRDG